MKRCPFCAEEIQDAAIVCKHCGLNVNLSLAEQQIGKPTAPQPQQTVVVQSSGPSPGVAAILSLIIPGAGQMYCGRVGLGLVWLIFVVMGYVAWIVPGLILHFICIMTAASMAQSATRSYSAPAATGATIPHENVTPLPQRPSTSAERTLGRALACLIHPRRAWPTLSGAGRLGLMCVYALIVLYVISISVYSLSERLAPTQSFVSDGPNKAHSLMFKKSPTERGDALRQVVESAGYPCDAARRVFSRGLDKNSNAYWSIGCGNGKNYQVQLKPDLTGSTSVLPCEALDATGSDCFKSFGEK